MPGLLAASLQQLRLRRRQRLLLPCLPRGPARSPPEQADSTHQLGAYLSR